MYQGYWGLDRTPFENSTDADHYYPSATHRAAFLKLRYALENHLGAAALVGGIGCGKSYMTFVLQEQLPDGYGPVIRLMFPQLGAAELLAYLAVELGADESMLEHAGLDSVLRQIEHHLRRLVARGRHPVIVIDDAHLIEDRHVLQALQLLLNYQQQPETDFTLILVGEYALLSRVQNLAPLSERIGVKCVLQPLTLEETRAYVEHRLDVAGSTRAIFDDAAFETIFELSNGYPRRINRLCDLALLVGFADQLEQIGPETIEAVSEELTTCAPC